MDYLKDIIEYTFSAAHDFRMKGTGPKPIDPEPPQLWYPSARYQNMKMKTHGKYRSGFPEGCVIHFTDGRDTDMENAIMYAQKMAHCYLLIDKEGNVGQCFPLNEYGSHAGLSKWDSFPGQTRLSSFLVGIEVMGAGLLTPSLSGKYTSWFGQSFVEAEVRHISFKQDNRKSGIYRRFTFKQERSLENLILWMHAQGRGVFNLDNVLGHDEVAPDRKSDPGGSLELTMPQYRQFLKLKALSL